MCGQWDQDRILDCLQGRLPATESERFKVHAASCASCRSAADDLSVFTRHAETEPLLPSPAAEETVLAVIRREAARRAGKRPTRRRLRHRGAAPTTAATAWVAAAAALFVVILLSALAKTPAPPRSLALRTPPSSAPAPEPLRDPAIPAPPRPPDPPPPTTPTTPTPPPFPRTESVPPPLDPPRDPVPVPAPVPPRTEPRRDPPPATVTETKPAAVEVAQIARGAARSERGALAAGDKIYSGETIQCPTGTLLLETADRSQVALKSGTSLTPEAAGDHLSLRLAEGEIACAVKPRPERRFVVLTAHGSATVKGTVFAVRATGSSTVVTVARGRVEARSDAGAQDVSAGERCSMSRSTMPGKPEPINADRHLAWATEAGLSAPGTLWIPATSPAAEFQAPMTRSRLFANGSLSGEPAFAAVDSRTLPNWNGRSLAPNQKDGGWVSFSIDLPEAGPWVLWGRFYYPGGGTTLWRQDGEVRENDPNSFFVSVDGAKEQVFGNHKVDPDTKTSWYHRWHWGGDGKVEVGQPAALSLGTLAKGRHTIRVRNRDAVETSALHLAPRLDALCLTTDRDYRPRDEDFRK